MVFEDWKQKIHKWEDIPLVKLKSLLEQTPWFSGTATLDVAEATWKVNHNNWPDLLDFNTSHCNKPITIQAWIEHNTRQFEVELVSPHSRRCRIRHGHTYQDALRHVGDMLEIAKQQWEAKATKEEEHERIAAEAEAKRQRLADRLGVSKLDEGGWSDQMCYRFSKNFGVDFSYLPPNTEENEEECFASIQIDGNFTLEELQQIIRIVSGSPQAIADKLTQ